MAEEYQVTITDKAEEDFDGIIHFLLTNYSRTSAEKAVLAIKEKILSLRDFPEAHPIYHKTRGPEKLVYRYVIAKKIHRIIFTVKVEKLHVIVSRITHIKWPKEVLLKNWRKNEAPIMGDLNSVFHSMYSL